VHPTIARIRDVLNAHDADGMAELFAPDYRGETPAHPHRSFDGPEQVAEDWREIFRLVPDVEVGIVKQSTDGPTAWTEWVWRGTRTDGDPFLMKGVTVMGLREDGRVQWTRLYMEPVEQGAAAIEQDVRRLSGATS
jgi:ketosteroid isomerase-like protein